MIGKLLITFATRAGSTEEIAGEIAAQNSLRGSSVTLLPVKEVRDLTVYDAIIVGSAVRMGQWLPEALNFVKSHADTLNNMPTAFFSVHGNNLSDDPASRTARLAYLDTVRMLVMPKFEGFFAGCIDANRLGLIDRMILKAVKSPQGDFRSWDVIRTWANSIFPG